MDAQGVLKNLTDYDSWEHTNYKLVKAEADVIIPLLKKEIPMECEVYIEDSETADGTPCTTEIQICPVCHEKYRFLLPKYCSECGQRLEKGVE